MVRLKTSPSRRSSIEPWLALGHIVEQPPSMSEVTLEEKRYDEDTDEDNRKLAASPGHLCDNGRNGNLV